MLDHCPAPNSCGTRIPIWTSQEPPTKVGVLTAIDVYDMSVAGGYKKCKGFKRRFTAIRCSHEKDDIIYRYTSGRSLVCVHAFCGMM